MFYIKYVTHTNIFKLLVSSDTHTTNSSSTETERTVTRPTQRRAEIVGTMSDGKWNHDSRNVLRTCVERVIIVHTKDGPTNNHSSPKPHRCVGIEGVEVRGIMERGSGLHVVGADFSTQRMSLSF